MIEIYQLLKYLIENLFFSGICHYFFEMGGWWVVNFPTLSHFCHNMSSLGGGGWVLKEI